MLLCAIGADDLTGACDAAVHFAARGRRTVVSLDLAVTTHAADVLAYSTETRDAAADEIRSRAEAAAASVLPLNPRILFKKVDSVMRGCPGLEITAALSSFGCDAALITPAFPAMGRTVRNGELYVGATATVGVSARLIASGLPSCIQVAPTAAAQALATGHRFVSIDTATEDDLDVITAEGLSSSRRILWAGSAGLARSLARALFVPEQPPPISAFAKPVVFCLGSTHEATMAQQSELLAKRTSVLAQVESAVPRILADALRAGKHVILRVTRGHTPPEFLHTVLIPLVTECGGLLACGGDTATLVCRAVGARAITLQHEIITGVPWGVLSGGVCSGLPLVTKSGGFAASDALIRVADWFTCPAE
jgi:D-threonate/D-erythronate kinase